MGFIDDSIIWNFFNRDVSFDFLDEVVLQQYIVFGLFLVFFSMGIFSIGVFYWFVYLDGGIFDQSWFFI